MNYWWLLVFVVALSPLTWLMPSQRQRGRMDVRMQARRLGIAMQLSPQTWPHWLPVEPPSSCPQYHRARSAERTDTWCYWQTEPGEWLDKWREPCVDNALLEQLSRLPSDVYSVEASKHMLALCWGEQGGNEALEQVASFLKANA